METIKVEQDEKITIITLNRPDKLNAINLTMSRELQQAMKEFDASDQRVLVLTGAGDRAFCAGADLAEFPEFWRVVPTVGVETNKPIIAAVEGICIGGGLVLAAFADICVATEDTKFSYPEGKVGVTGGMVAGIAARIPHKAAMDIMLLGRTFTGRRAYEMGLVTECVAPGKSLETAMEMARELVDMAPLVVQYLKDVVNNHMLPKSPAEEMMRAMIVTDQIAGSADVEEGKRAFFEKRKPKFVGH
ncbi:enoyl-CoA hydratase/isomerase family protein [Sneathiella sp.]|uniref:enoyl-CoA hydratase/isomerase family protein n=1 Tax=Sneathiella sp. TaxID=1964365 RepID=UPI003566F373